MVEEEIKEEEDVEKPVPVAVTPPEHVKLMDRLNEMDARVEFVAGELWQRQGERLGFTIGLLYGVLIGMIAYVIFLM